ncbi:hypothetical protein [Streptomyces sp. YIM 132580]|uniref:hypothetical protein n=1 Tax=Streptomyces sp. YIM 132580 TaxID=2691958 RepID=UPI001369D138|nr:hypothetical protein [Streptomyces sp. YIM 132580]MXG30462.1 hypothetical protein [Streptomyces sp. YIM 132580]
MSTDVTDLLASIDDVLETAPVAAPAVPVPAVPATAAPASVAVVQPVEEQPCRSTVTDVPYSPVGPRIAQRIAGLDPASVVQQQKPLDARASEPAPVVEPPAPPEPAPPVELPAVDKTGARARLRRAKFAPAPAAGAAPAAVPVRERNPRVRWLAFNGLAAGAGHLAIWSLTGDPMAGADLMGRMTVSVPQLAAAGLTIGAAYGGWKAGGYLTGLPGRLGLVARPLAAVVGGLWGQGTAPLVRDVLDAVEPWGTLLSPLLAVAPLAAACWYGLDRRAARLTRPVRWALRIPLATVVVSSLLYAPGVLL